MDQLASRPSPAFAWASEEIPRGVRTPFTVWADFKGEYPLASPPAGHQRVWSLFQALARVPFQGLKDYTSKSPGLEKGLGRI